jgi:predicted Zn-dependent protease
LPDFSNPQVPQDEINVSEEKPLRSFLALALGAIVICGAAAAALAFAAGSLAHRLPFSVEERLIAPYAARYPAREHRVEGYLQSVADRLAGRMSLPAGMRVRVHYVEEPAVNAFATLGGHIAVFRGLIEKVPDENTLAMVIGHEIGHLQNRHPIRSFGRGIAFAALLSTVSLGAGNYVADRVLGGAGMLTLLSFSRSQEEESDAAALDAIVAVYGHAGGATETFRLLQEAAAAKGGREPPQLLSTHPLSQQRIERLAAQIEKAGIRADGPRTALPEAVRLALEQGRGDKSPRKAR